MLSADLRDSILVVVKIGDLGAYRDGQIISYIDPLAQKLSDPGSKWDPSAYPCGVMDSVAYGQVVLPRSEIPTIRELLNEVAIADEETKERTVVDLTAVDYALSISDWRAQGKEVAPVQKATLTLVKKPIEATTVKDLNAVTAGSYTIGTGGDYDQPSTAFADKGATTAGNTLNFTVLNALTDNGAINDNVAVNGTFNYNGQNFLVSSDVNAYYHQISTPASTGTVNYYNQNHKNLYDKAAIGGILRCLSTMTFTGTLNIYNMRADVTTTSSAVVSALIFNSINPTVMTLRNFIGKGYTSANNNCYGLFTNSDPGVNSREIENIILDAFYRAVSNGNYTNTYRNSVLINNTTNIYLISNSTSVNCATDAASVGATTNTSSQVLITAANELVNTDVSDQVNGYRLKSTSTKLKNNGAAVTIAANTTDIFGRPRPGAGGYSIGVAEAEAAGKRMMQIIPL